MARRDRGVRTVRGCIMRVLLLLLLHDCAICICDRDCDCNRNRRLSGAGVPSNSLQISPGRFPGLEEHGGGAGSLQCAQRQPTYTIRGPYLGRPTTGLPTHLGRTRLGACVICCIRKGVYCIYRDGVSYGVSCYRVSCYRVSRIADCGLHVTNVPSSSQYRAKKRKSVRWFWICRSCTDWIGLYARDGRSRRPRPGSAHTQRDTCPEVVGQVGTYEIGVVDRQV